MRCGTRTRARRKSRSQRNLLKHRVRVEDGSSAQRIDGNRCGWIKEDALRAALAITVNQRKAHHTYAYDNRNHRQSIAITSYVRIQTSKLLTYRPSARPADTAWRERSALGCCGSAGGNSDGSRVGCENVAKRL